MMDVRLQLFLACCCLGFFILCIQLLRKGLMEYKYALLWLSGSVLMILAVLFPHGLFELSKLVGIIDPTNMVFFLGFFLSLLIIFSLSVIVSRLSGQIRRLTQFSSLMEKRLEDLELSVRKNGMPE